MRPYGGIVGRVVCPALCRGEACFALFARRRAFATPSPPAPLPEGEGSQVPLSKAVLQHRTPKVERDGIPPYK